jgi:hypothetical protein
MEDQEQGRLASEVIATVGANRTPLRVEGPKPPATAISGDAFKHCAIVKGDVLCWPLERL